MAKLSTRSLANIEPNDIKRIMGTGSSNSYNAVTNPTGIISLGVAENRLMHDDLCTHVNSHLAVTRRDFTYGDGSVGSDRLRSSVAKFMNEHAFSPRKPLVRTDVTILSGVSSVIDCLAFCLCEAGEGILLGRPAYVGFISDLVNRAAVKPVMVTFNGVEPTSLEAVECYEKAFVEAQQNGTPVRALLLCNPHNPFGTSYAPQVLTAYLELCARHNIHFISDEVYANSTFPSSDFSSPPPFTSVLSLDLHGIIDPSLVHCLYGMSKDFCSNGFRLGAFISQENPQLHAAMRAVSKFAWPSSIADAAWSALLNDVEFISKYLDTLQHRLTEAYECCIRLLKKHEIPYIPAHAGPFVWINLSKHLSSLTVEAERELAWKMIHNKLWLATGEAYRSEQPGWFRLTFAVDKAELQMGIDRLLLSLSGQEDMMAKIV